MRKTTKITSIILTVLMIFSLFPLTAFATNAYDVTFDGYNCSVAADAIGTGIISTDADYTLVINPNEGYKIYDVSVYVEDDNV